jgi:hypothetical protein
MGKVNKYRSLLALVIIISVAVLACSRSSITPVDYASYVEDPAHGLKIFKSLNGYGFSLQYESVDYKIVKKHHGKGITRALLDRERQEYDSLQYFVLRIKNESGQDVLKSGIADVDSYYARVQYLFSAVQKDMYIVEGSDTLRCMLSHFERDYSLSPYVTLVTGFELKSGKTSATDKVFVIEDNAFGNGIIKIKINAGDITNIPSLITE